MTTETVASQIRSQLGHKCFYMLGAKNLGYTNDSLSFKISGSRKVSHVKIELTPLDLYTVTYFKYFNYDLKIVSVDENIYADMLHRSIEKNTGLNTSL